MDLADSAASVPELAAYVLHARRGKQAADFAVLPCTDGWYTHFLSGEPALRDYNRYCSYESLDELKRWWHAEFDRFTLDDMAAEQEETLHHLVVWQNW